MKIAYVYDAVHPWVTGGVEQRIWELARRLADEHDVHWFGFKYWDGPRRIHREGVTFHGVAPAPDLHAGDRRSISAAIWFGTRVTAPLLAHDFDVVDCQAFPYFAAFPTKLHRHLRRSAFVLTWHEFWGDFWNEYLGRIGVAGKAVERFAARLPDRHVAVSELTADAVRRVAGAGVDVVPNGVSLAQIDAVTPANKEVDVLFVGRLIPEKGVDILVEAVAQLRDAGADRNLTVVGEGPERGRLGRLAADRAPGAVEFLDFRGSHDDVISLMKAARVFALPSRREGFGMTVLEALACGTPVVTVEHPRNAAADLVAERAGTVCAPRPDALADAIAGTPDRARAPRATVEEYEWDRVADRIVGVYEEVT